MSKTYSREEADEILRRALGQQTSDGISHDDLVAAAREVGIPETAILDAANQVDEHRVVKARVEQLRRQKRRAFARHLLTYMIVNGGIFAFDHFDGGPYFFLYPLIIWGIVLLLLGIRQLAPDEARLVKRAERELERERRRQQRQRRRSQHGPGRPLMPEAAKEFESAVQEGVSALMSAAARAIRDFTPAQRPGAGGPGARSSGAGTKYRAEEPEAEDTPGEHRGAEARRQGRA